MIDTKFVCPCCAGGTYGTVDTSAELLTRRCHGVVWQRDDDGDVVAVSCDFRWPITDDWKYIWRCVKHDSVDDPFPDLVTALWRAWMASPDVARASWVPEAMRTFVAALARAHP